MVYGDERYGSADLTGGSGYKRQTFAPMRAPRNPQDDAERRIADDEFQFQMRAAEGGDPVVQMVQGTLPGKLLEMRQAMEAGDTDRVVGIKNELSDWASANSTQLADLTSHLSYVRENRQPYLYRLLRTAEGLATGALWNDPAEFDFARIGSAPRDAARSSTESVNEWLDQDSPERVASRASEYTREFGMDSKMATALAKTHSDGSLMHSLFKNDLATFAALKSDKEKVKDRDDVRSRILDKLKLLDVLRADIANDDPTDPRSLAGVFPGGDASDMDLRRWVDALTRGSTADSPLDVREARQLISEYEATKSDTDTPESFLARRRRTLAAIAPRKDNGSQQASGAVQAGPLFDRDTADAAIAMLRGMNAAMSKYGGSGMPPASLEDDKIRVGITRELAMQRASGVDPREDGTASKLFPGGYGNAVGKYLLSQDDRFMYNQALLADPDVQRYRALRTIDADVAARLNLMDTPDDVARPVVDGDGNPVLGRDGKPVMEASPKKRTAIFSPVERSLMEAFRPIISRQYRRAYADAVAAGHDPREASPYIRDLTDALEKVQNPYFDKLSDVNRNLVINEYVLPLFGYGEQKYASFDEFVGTRLTGVLVKDPETGDMVYAGTGVTDVPDLRQADGGERQESSAKPASSQYQVDKSSGPDGKMSNDALKKLMDDDFVDRTFGDDLSDGVRESLKGFGKAVSQYEVVADPSKSPGHIFRGQKTNESREYASVQRQGTSVVFENAVSELDLDDETAELLRKLETAFTGAARGGWDPGSVFRGDERKGAGLQSSKDKTARIAMRTISLVHRLSIPRDTDTDETYAARRGFAEDIARQLFPVILDSAGSGSGSVDMGEKKTRLAATDLAFQLGVGREGDAAVDVFLKGYTPQNVGALLERVAGYVSPELQADVKAAVKVHHKTWRAFTGGDAFVRARAVLAPSDGSNSYLAKYGVNFAYGNAAATAYNPYVVVRALRDKHAADVATDEVKSYRDVKAQDRDRRNAIDAFYPFMSPDSTRGKRDAIISGVVDKLKAQYGERLDEDMLKSSFLDLYNRIEETGGAVLQRPEAKGAKVRQRMDPGTVLQIFSTVLDGAPAPYFFRDASGQYSYSIGPASRWNRESWKHLNIGTYNGQQIVDQALKKVEARNQEADSRAMSRAAATHTGKESEYPIPPTTFGPSQL